jgi:hypothetical protein
VLSAAVVQSWSNLEKLWEKNKEAPKVLYEKEEQPVTGL